MSEQTQAARLPGEIVRLADLPFEQLGKVPNALEQITDNQLDMVLVRGAFPPEAIAAAQRSLARTDLEWLQLNEGLPALDIKLLGWPSFPTLKSLKGPTPEQHFASGERFTPVINGLFEPPFKPQERFEEVFRRLSGGRPPQLPPAPPGKQHLPFTVRSSAAGVGTYSHIDHHFALPFIQGLATHLDNSELISFFVMLQSSDKGGELTLYDLKRGRDELPKLPNGMWDQAAINQVARTHVDPRDGDMIIFAASRCFHKVEPAAGPRPRVTFGGLMALDKDRKSVWYWG